MDFLIGATDIVARQFGEPDGSAHDLILLTTDKGYTLAVDRIGLHHIARGETGLPIVGGRPMDRKLTESHQGTEDYGAGFLAGLVLTSGRVVKTRRVCGHVDILADRGADIARVLSILESQARGVLGHNGRPFPIQRNEFDNGYVEIASRYIDLLVADRFDDLGNDFDLDSILSGSESLKAGFFGGVVAGRDASGVIQFRSKPVAAAVHAQLAQDFGIVGTLSFDDWSPELRVVRTATTRMPSIALDGVVSSFGEHRIASAKAIGGPAVRVSIPPGEMTFVSGFLLSGSGPSPEWLQAADALLASLS